MNVDDRFGFSAGIIIIILGLVITTIPFQIFGGYEFSLINGKILTLLTVGIGALFIIIGYKTMRLNLK